MANAILNFLFQGNSSQLVSSSAQAANSLAQVAGKIAGINVAALGSLAGIGLLAVGLKDLTGTLIEISGEFQRLSTSFVSILAAPLIASNKGAALTKENLEVLRNQSVKLFQDTQIAAIDTTATTKEYASTLQSAVATGQNVGLTLGQIEDLTKRMVLAAGAFGVEIDTVGTTISQVFSGTLRVTNPLGRNLGLVTKEARDQLKVAIEQGKLYEFLDAKLKNYGATQKEVSNNFLNVKAAITDIFQLGGTAAVAPLFKFVGDQLIAFRDRFISGDQFFKPALQSLVNGIQDFLKTILPAARVALNEFGNLLNTLGGASGGAASVLRLLIIVFGDFLKILRESISFQGLPGFLTAIFLVSTAVRGLIALIPILTGEIQTLVLGFLEIQTAMAALAARDAVAFGSSLLALGPVVGTVIALAAAIGGLIYLLVNSGKSTEDLAESLQKIDKQFASFSEAQQKFINDRNLRALIDDYRQLES